MIAQAVNPIPAIPSVQATNYLGYRDRVADATAALSTVFTNTTGRRLLVIIAVTLTSSIAVPSAATYVTTVAGVTRSAKTFGGITGLVEVGTFAAWFPVDPGGTYSVAGTGSAAATIASWTEITA